MDSIFTDKHGRAIKLSFCETNYICKASFQNKALGEFAFKEYDPDNDSAILLMTYCHLEDQPGFTMSGIGEAILRLITENGYTIYAHPNDGVQRPDGSHLTGGAPSFVSKMIERNLIFKLNNLG